MTVCWQDLDRLAKELDHLFGWDSKIVEEARVRCESLARALSPEQLTVMLEEMFLDEQAAQWLRDLVSRVE